MNSFLKRLRDERDALRNTISETLTRAAEEDRELSDAENTNLTDSDTRVRELDTRIEHLSEIELRNAAAAELATRVDDATATDTETRGTPQARVTRDEPVYRPDIAESFFSDLVHAREGDFVASERLQRHNRDMDSTGNAAAFSPPQYLTELYSKVNRSGRPVANAVPSMAHPKTNTWTIPRITQGSDVDFQAGENTAFANQDLDSTQVTVNSKTLGGFVDVSLQALEYGSVAADQVIFADLSAELARAIEVFVLQNNVAGAYGILRQPNSNSVTYDGSFAVDTLYAKIAAAANAVDTNRLAAAEVVLMHPRRWHAIKSASDTADRPLISPVAPSNSPGAFGSAVEGSAGSIYGLPVLVTHSIPVVSPEATPALTDDVVVAKLSDCILWETAPTSLVDPYSGSANGTVRLRLHAFVGFTAGRQPAGISIVSGTALGNPF